MSRDIVCHAQYNSSSSKQMFSFSKAKRFPTKCDAIYDPTILSPKNSKTFGLRSKLPSQITITPAPGTYNNIISDFSEATKRVSYSFGTSRSAYEKVYFKHKPVRGIGSPGPGTYALNCTIGDNTAKYTIRPKTTSLTKIEKIPGPGAYNIASTITLRGRNFLSKFKSSHAPLICPNSARFAPLNKTLLKNPGPGHYDFPSLTNVQRSFYISKFRKTMALKFGSEERSTDLGWPMKTPGPGSYDTGCDFAIVNAGQNTPREYEFSKKHISLIERLKKYTKSNV